jgi:hypothetical protein
MVLSIGAYAVVYGIALIVLGEQLRRWRPESRAGGLRHAA